MTETIDDLYPYLSAFARSKGKSLKELGESADVSHEDYLRLADCCSLVTDRSSRGKGCDVGNYLATLDAFINSAGSNLPGTLWKKLSGVKSQFLDTVVEVAWMLYFKDQGFTVQPEVPFDPGNPKAKNADLLVTIDREKWFLDAVSVGPAERGPASRATGPIEPGRGGIEFVFSVLEKKVDRKYSRKFKEAFDNGLLRGSSVGLLVCIVKSEESMLNQLRFMGGNMVRDLASIFSNKHPGLDLVWIHTLSSPQDNEILVPDSYCKWVRNEAKTL